MRSPSLFTLAGIAMLGLFALRDCYAQSDAPQNAGPSKPDQMQELVQEVHKLRLVMQQISVNAYQGQVLVERLRLQQEQINRLTQELNGIRNQISDMKSRTSQQQGHA